VVDPRDQPCGVQRSGRVLDRSGARAKAAEDDHSRHGQLGEARPQEGSAYNGHFGCTCYHPLFCFNQFGDLERSLLRRGNAHSAEEWKTVLVPVAARYRERRLRRYFRADAAFAMPEILRRDNGASIRMRRYRRVRDAGRA
jgi:Transposase DDE domain group 1